MSTKKEIDNRANQLNLNNDAYWQSRSLEGRPENWQSLLTVDSECDVCTMDDYKPYCGDDFD